MRAIEISPGVEWVGVQDPELRLFDIYLRTESGTSYNSYLIRGQTATALIDTAKENFVDEYLDRLRSAIDPRQIDYLILQHLEPDHAGSVAALLDLAPQAQVIISRNGAHFLKNLFKRDFSPRLVGDGDTVDLGGRTLHFWATPFLHWPDTMVSYLPEEAILFSTDVFGSHYASEALFDDLLPDFSSDFAYYFDHIMRPFKDHVRRALDKLEGLELRLIAPGHGPVLRKNPRQAFLSYRQWAAPRPATGALLVYASIYGRTGRLADAIEAGLRATGTPVERRLALDLPAKEWRDLLESARALVVGSPTVNGDAVQPVWQLLSSFPNIRVQGKVAGAFGSYGWSGEAVELLENRLKGLKFQVPESGPRAILTPSPEDLAAAEAFGRRLGEKIS